MNRSHIEHIVFALLMQTGIGLATANWWIGAAFGAAFFIGREHAQREYKIGDPAELRGYEAFDLWRWSKDALLDLLLPAVAVTALAIYMEIFQ